MLTTGRQRVCPLLEPIHLHILDCVDSVSFMADWIVHFVEYGDPAILAHLFYHRAGIYEVVQDFSVNLSWRLLLNYLTSLKYVQFLENIILKQIFCQEPGQAFSFWLGNHLLEALHLVLECGWAHQAMDLVLKVELCLSGHFF